MSIECDNKNCEKCNTCCGDGKCFKSDNPIDHHKHVFPNDYTRHKCQYSCSLRECTKCQSSFPKWRLNENRGFCWGCAIELSAMYDKLFGKDNEYYNMFISKIIDIFTIKKEREISIKNY